MLYYLLKPNKIEAISHKPVLVVYYLYIQYQLRRLGYEKLSNKPEHQGQAAREAFC